MAVNPGNNMCKWTVLTSFIEDIEFFALHVVVKTLISALCAFLEDNIILTSFVSI